MENNNPFELEEFLSSGDSGATHPLFGMFYGWNKAKKQTYAGMVSLRNGAGDITVVTGVPYDEAYDAARAYRDTHPDLDAGAIVVRHEAAG